MSLHTVKTYIGKAVTSSGFFASLEMPCCISFALEVVFRSWEWCDLHTSQIQVRKPIRKPPEKLVYWQRKEKYEVHLQAIEERDIIRVHICFRVFHRKKQHFNQFFFFLLFSKFHTVGLGSGNLNSMLLGISRRFWVGTRISRFPGTNVSCIFVGKESEDIKTDKEWILIIQLQLAKLMPHCRHPKRSSPPPKSHKISELCGIKKYFCTLFLQVLRGAVAWNSAFMHPKKRHLGLALIYVY